MAANFLGKSVIRDFAKTWVWTNDSFFGMLSPADLKREFPWDQYLAALPEDGVHEWVVHPGLPDDTLLGRDDYNAHRATELQAMTSPAGVKYWERFRANLARKSVLHRKETKAPT